MIIKKIALILAVIITFSFAATSCQTETENDVDTTQSTDNTLNNDDTSDEVEKDEEKDEYDFPDVNYGGKKFVILNNEPIWDFTTIIVPEEQVGEALNDAMWSRNTAINEQFNVQLEELAIAIHDVPSRVKRSVQSGAQDFDAVFCSGSIGGNTVGAMVAEGILVDLTTLPELNLSSPWWNQKALEDAKIGSSSAIYFASNDISIHALQCPWVIYFNEDMFQALGLERPYQLVRDGKWTYDQMYTYMRAAVNINADTSFTPYSATGTSIYGLSTAVPA